MNITEYTLEFIKNITPSKIIIILMLLYFFGINTIIGIFTLLFGIFTFTELSINHFFMFILCVLNLVFGNKISFIIKIVLLIYSLINNFDIFVNIYNTIKKVLTYKNIVDQIVISEDRNILDELEKWVNKIDIIINNIKNINNYFITKIKSLDNNMSIYEIVKDSKKMIIYIFSSLDYYSYIIFNIIYNNLLISFDYYPLLYFVKLLDGYKRTSTLIIVNKENKNIEDNFKNEKMMDMIDNVMNSFNKQNSCDELDEELPSFKNLLQNNDLNNNLHLFPFKNLLQNNDLNDDTQLSSLKNLFQFKSDPLDYESLLKDLVKDIPNKKISIKRNRSPQNIHNTSDNENDSDD
jgi:hypothetical protein